MILRSRPSIAVQREGRGGSGGGAAWTGGGSRRNTPGRDGGRDHCGDGLIIGSLRLSPASELVVQSFHRTIGPQTKPQMRSPAMGTGSQYGFWIGARNLSETDAVSTHFTDSGKPTRTAATPSSTVRQPRFLYVGMRCFRSAGRRPGRLSRLPFRISGSCR